MGQYYSVVNVDKRQVLCPYDFGCGVKLTEFSWDHTKLPLALYTLIGSGQWMGDRVLVVGDYAYFDLIPKNVWDPDNEVICDGKTPYNYADENFKMLSPQDIPEPLTSYRYMFNTKEKTFVDVKHMPVSSLFDGHSMAPLPLLLAVGNGEGGGDYYGVNRENIGAWVSSCDAIVLSNDMLYPEFSEFFPGFCE